MDVKRTNRKYLDQGERKDVSETGKNPEGEGEMHGAGGRNTGRDHPSVSQADIIAARAEEGVKQDTVRLAFFFF